MTTKSNAGQAGTLNNGNTHDKDKHNFVIDKQIADFQREFERECERVKCLMAEQEKNTDPGRRISFFDVLFFIFLLLLILSTLI